jgi:hypothetical protein
MTNTNCCEYNIETPDDGQKMAQNRDSWKKGVEQARNLYIL